MADLDLTYPMEPDDVAKKNKALHGLAYRALIGEGMMPDFNPFNEFKLLTDIYIGAHLEASPNVD